MNKIHNPILKVIDKEYWLEYYANKKPEKPTFVSVRNFSDEEYLMLLKQWGESKQSVLIHPSQVEAFKGIARMAFCNNQDQFVFFSDFLEKGIDLPSDSPIEIRRVSDQGIKDGLLQFRKYAFLKTEDKYKVVNPEKNTSNYMHVEGTEIKEATLTVSPPLEETKPSQEKKYTEQDMLNFIIWYDMKDESKCHNTFKEELNEWILNTK